MNILLVYPRNPDTFWGFKHALKFIGKRTTLPPLGLLTIATFFPDDWQIKLVDLNCEQLDAQLVKDSDYVLVSAMAIQKESVDRVLDICRNFEKPVIAGGPLFTLDPDAYIQSTHIVFGEAESLMPQLISDMQNHTVKREYRSVDFPDLQKSPIPNWRLLQLKWYNTMNIQFSRGCPFSCEFCDIAALNGKIPRVKSADQVIAELDSLRDVNWRGPVFFVDDNFIGMRSYLKKEVLPKIIQWQKRHRYPFSFSTETSIDLAGDRELLNLMVEAGFDKVFIGIETPNADSLKEAQKLQNIKLNLEDAIKLIQRAGLEVQGGFILGFDHDQPTIFHQQYTFIQKTGILSAMVGLLNAPRGSKLYERMKNEGRLLHEFTGNNVDTGINFTPKMCVDVLENGYKNLLQSLYTPVHYYQRLKTFLCCYSNKATHPEKLRPTEIRAFLRSIFVLGIFEKERKHYWKLFFWTLFRKTKAFQKFITLAICGYHYRKVMEQIIAKG